MSGSIYDIPVRRITGKESSLGEFKGKVVLVVNVASKCGLTKQYEGLEKLYAQYREQGLVVAGFPANDFAGQEPGTNADIQNFCIATFGVDFPMFEKITVVGVKKHPLYHALIEAQPKTEGAAAAFSEKLKSHGINPNLPPEVLWNFEKFLVSRDGRVVKRFSPDMEPDDPVLLKAMQTELSYKVENVGVKTQTVNIKTDDGNCDTFIAYPDDKAPHPAVLFLMDAFGPRDYLYQMAKTLAAQGYYVLLPNLFYRICPAPVTNLKFPLSTEDMKTVVKDHIMPLFQSFRPEFCMRDAGVLLDYLKHQKEVQSGKIGVTGYCMGGAMAIRVAARYPDHVAAAASFHAGNLATEAPDSPHRLLNNIKAEVYIAHADHDQSMPPEQIERLYDALQQSGLHYKTELYNGAAHGFTMMDLPAYNEVALKKHWDVLFALFERSLKNSKVG